MYINKNEEPIAYIRSDNYSRAGLVICVLAIVALSLFSIVYETIGIYSFGV